MLINKSNHIPCNSYYKSCIISEINKYSCSCGKKYKHRSSLCRHKKSCKFNKVNSEKENLIASLLEQNNELLSRLNQNTIVTNITNTVQQQNIKNDITFKIFLDDKCKDAISLDHFIKNLKVNMADYVSQVEHGYIKGVGDVIVKNLNDIEFNNRPIHCTDIKKRQFYIKDKQWEVKDGEAVAEKIFPLITTTMLKHVNRIWNEEYGANWDINDTATDEYSKTILVLTQSHSKKNMHEQLQTIDYVSKNIYVKIGNLLTNN